ELQRRLGEMTAARPDRIDEPPQDRTMIQALKRMGAMAPRSTKELGKLQQRLVTAGFRSREAIVVFYGVRLGAALIFFALSASPILVGRPNLAMALAACALGYILPGIVLA